MEIEKNKRSDRGKGSTVCYPIFHKKRWVCK